MSRALLSSTYFGPVQWYQKLNRYDEADVERFDNYVKQTYRNRCVIATTNGMQALTIPVESFPLSNDEAQESVRKCLMKDVRISDHGNWRHLHWNALMSAYGESPFFEYYADDIRPFFEKRWEFLFDFNMEICEKMCELLDIRPKINITNHFLPISSENNGTANTAGNASEDNKDNSDTDADDYREIIRPKHPQKDDKFDARPYYQVYKEKYGFMPNLSILDLLFNEGNESVYFL